MENDQLDLFEEVRCEACRKKLPRLDAFIVEKITDKGDIEIPFCNEQEANDHYLERLRNNGL